MRRCAVLIALVFFPFVTKGELLPVKAYAAADGLASERVNSIAADSRGFLWFCTPEGLSRFDGTRFVTYGVADGLPDAAVFVFRETRRGDRWIGTARGLSRIAGARFENRDLGGAVIALVQSRSGAMWAATRTNLYEWTDPAHIRRFRFSPPDKQHITTAMESSDGKLWVGTTSGLVVLDQDRVVQSFAKRDGLPGEWVESLMQDSKGRVWCALRGGLARFDTAGGRWSLSTPYTDELSGLDVKTVFESSDGTLWVGTTHGISRLKWTAGVTPSIENLGRAQGLTDPGITSFAEDSAGNMWVGTASAGAMRIGRLGFATFHEQDGLGSDRVWSVLQGRAGEIVAVTIRQDNTRARAVAIFDGVRFRRVTPHVFTDKPSWGMNQILLQSRSGEWWAASREGLCRFAAMRAEDLDGRDPMRCYASDAEIFTIFEDSKGGIWASARSGRGDRLMRWDPRTDTIADLAGRKSSPPELVSAFAEDGQGNVWMGMYKGGLFRFDGREFEPIRDVAGVPAGPVLALLSSPSGLWIGTDGGGLGRIEDPASPAPHVRSYRVASGMSSDIVACLVDDHSGHIYAGTAKGVDRLDPRTGHVRHFSTADGLAHGAITAGLRDESGALWFATTQGLSRLVVAKERVPERPRILITDLRAGNEIRPISRVGETRIVLSPFQPSDNHLQADFVGIDYEPGDVVRYSYKLEGADSQWSVPRTQPDVSYAALTAGHYRFLVRAVTADGVESATPASIEFSVLPPVWRRWWFVGLAVALIAAFAFAAHRYRVAQMVGIERMRTAIATDLHDDIGASLSQIAILSEVARIGGNGREPSEALERVATLARGLVESMSEIVWSIRSEPRAGESLVRHMREFALDVLTSQGIEFQLRTPQPIDNLHLSLDVRRQLFLMFKECIHNAVRHSRCTAVVAELGIIGHEIVLTVADNGVGSDANAPGDTEGTGIAGMQRRARNLGGRMEWISTPGRGSRGEIHVPL